MKLVVFSGTSEGHALCRFLSARGARAEAFVATEYGAAVMEPLPGVTVHEGRLDTAQIAAQLDGPSCEALEDLSRPVMIATRDIDREVADVARMIGYAVNMALHPHLTVEDIDLYLS